MTNTGSVTLSNRQRIFIRYSYAILIDLTVLNLFNQYWDYVVIENFTISLFAAILLQALLQVTILVEHKVSERFKGREGLKPKIQRGLATWGILFGSKFAILEAIDFTFGDSVQFLGPVHGLAAFFGVIIAIIVAEQLIAAIHRRLGSE